MQRALIWLTSKVSTVLEFRGPRKRFKLSTVQPVKSFLLSGHRQSSWNLHNCTEITWDSAKKIGRTSTWALSKGQQQLHWDTSQQHQGTRILTGMSTTFLDPHLICNLIRSHADMSSIQRLLSRWLLTCYRFNTATIVAATVAERALVLPSRTLDVTLAPTTTPCQQRWSHDQHRPPTDKKSDPVIAAAHNKGSNLFVSRGQIRKQWTKICPRSGGCKLLPG